MEKQVDTIRQAMDVIEGNDALPMVEFGGIISKIDQFAIEYVYMDELQEISITMAEASQDLDEVVNIMVARLIGEAP